MSAMVFSRRSPNGGSPPHGADFAARSAAAVEEIRAVALETADVLAERHGEPLEHHAALGVDVAQLALVAFPGAVPQLAVDEAHAGHEAVRFDRAQHGARVRVDFQDLSVAILADPQRAFGPRETGVAPLAGRRDRREHGARLRIDLVDPRLGDLIEVRAVERSAGVAGAV